jgi:DNA repair exonuclease SbcCD ATPase subunit
MPDALTLTPLVRHARTLLDQEIGRAAEVGRRGQQVQAQLASLREDHVRHEHVSVLLTRIGEQRQESAQLQIEQLVTNALQVIFDKTLSFHLVTSVRANQPQVDFIIRSDYDGEITDTPVMDARGGGMAVVVAFLLRLVVLLLTPGAARVMFLDESFAHVSAEYEVRVAEFLREVCDKARVQIIMITHSDAYADLADTRYRLALSLSGVTEVTQL